MQSWVINLSVSFCCCHSKLSHGCPLDASLHELGRAEIYALWVARHVCCNGYHLLFPKDMMQ